MRPMVARHRKAPREVRIADNAVGTACAKHAGVHQSDDWAVAAFRLRLDGDYDRHPAHKPTLKGTPMALFNPDDTPGTKWFTLGLFQVIPAAAGITTAVFTPQQLVHLASAAIVALLGVFILTALFQKKAEAVREAIGRLLDEDKQMWYPLLFCISMGTFLLFAIAAVAIQDWLL